MRMFLFATGKDGCTHGWIPALAEVALGRNDAAGNFHMRVTISR